MFSWLQLVTVTPHPRAKGMLAEKRPCPPTPTSSTCCGHHCPVSHSTQPPAALSTGKVKPLQEAVPPLRREPPSPSTTARALRTSARPCPAVTAPQARPSTSPTQVHASSEAGGKPRTCALRGRGTYLPPPHFEPSPGARSSDACAREGRGERASGSRDRPASLPGGATSAAARGRGGRGRGRGGSGGGSGPGWRRPPPFRQPAAAGAGPVRGCIG